MTFVASPRIRSVGCIYAGRCVYASGRCVYAAGAYTHQGAYTRVGAFTRVVGAYTQRVHICYMHPGRCIRGSVRIRERWVCIHRGCVYAPPRVYTVFCRIKLRIHAPPRLRSAYTQEIDDRTVINVCKTVKEEVYRCTRRSFFGQRCHLSRACADLSSRLRSHAQERELLSYTTLLVHS